MIFGKVYNTPIQIYFGILRLDETYYNKHFIISDDLWCMLDKVYICTHHG